MKGSLRRWQGRMSLKNINWKNWIRKHVFWLWRFKVGKSLSIHYEKPTNWYIYRRFSLGIKTCWMMKVFVITLANQTSSVSASYINIACLSWSDPCVVHASSSLEMTFPATNPTRNMTRFYQISQCKLSLKIRNNFIDALKISPSYIRLFGKDPWIQMHTCENWDIRQYGKLQHQSCVNIGCVWFHKKNMHFLRLNQNW